MRLAETDHVICFSKSHGLFTTSLTLCRIILIGRKKETPYYRLVIKVLFPTELRPVRQHVRSSVNCEILE